MCGIDAVEAQGCGCMFTFCHAYLKMGVLLHKMAIVCNQTFMAVHRQYVYQMKAENILNSNSLESPYLQFPKMNMDRLPFYEAKVLFSEGRGRM